MLPDGAHVVAVREVLLQQRRELADLGAGRERRAVLGAQQGTHEPGRTGRVSLGEAALEQPGSNYITVEVA